MKTKYISIVTILLCLFVVTPNTYAKEGFLKALGKFGKALVGAAVGYVDKKVEERLPEEQRETWHDMTRTFNSDLGVNDSYANAGRNWAEGKKKDSFVDVGEGALSDAEINNTGVQTALNFARIQNEYNRDIQSGMSTKEAYERRFEKLKQLAIKAGSTAFNNIGDSKSDNQWSKEEKQWEGKYENGILLELIRRGYSSDEAHMYMTIIHNNPGLLRSLSGGNAKESDDSSLSYEERYKKYKESIEHMTNMLVYDEYVQSQINELLNNLNIRDRREDDNFNYSDYENSFFGTAPLNTPDREEKNNNFVETPPETPPLPVVDERANAITAITGTVLNSYEINDVELSDAQKEDLNQVAAKLNKYEDLQIILLGHTCNIGSQKVNQDIGEGRAKAAKNYLISKGVSENRIQIESRDFSEPVVDNDNENHRKQNRRVTFIVK